MTEPAHHRLHVAGQRGGLSIDVALELAAPWTIIFGPSGSGKSTLLRALCGALPGLNVQLARHDPATQHWIELVGRHSLPPQSRGLGYAPQGAAVFPHLTVRQNVEFAWRSTGAAASSRAFVDEAIELFALQPLLGRRPHNLSGGERQGVALARAFAAPGVRLMLLDEPFSGVGRTMRDFLLPRMRSCLAARHVPALSVTHDVEESLLLAAEVVRLDAGAIGERGPATLILAPERDRILRALDERGDR